VEVLPRVLGPFDAVTIVVGSIIGSGIFLKVSNIDAQVPSFGAIMAVWLLGGAATLSGSLSLAELAAKASATGGPIGGRSSLNTEGAGPGFGMHICDVEVDPETGKVEVLRYTAFQDVGRAIHPSYVEGQLQGGVAQGIGWALHEECIYDAKGQLDNPGFLDYRMPVASDLPMIEPILIEVPNEKHPQGIRGVGEVPLVPALAAVANAIRNATGLRLTDLPMSPPKVLAALSAAK